MRRRITFRYFLFAVSLLPATLRAQSLIEANPISINQIETNQAFNLGHDINTRSCWPTQYIVDGGIIPVTAINFNEIILPSENNDNIVLRGWHMIQVIYPEDGGHGYRACGAWVVIPLDFKPYDNMLLDNIAYSEARMRYGLPAEYENYEALKPH